jgi:hypothetical protein
MRMTDMPDNQMKSVTTMVEQKAENLRERGQERAASDATRPGSRLSGVGDVAGGSRRSIETWRRRKCRDQHGLIEATEVRWICVLGVFHRQFETAADHRWTSSEKAAHLLAVLQGQAADVLHSVPPGVTYEDIVGAPKDRYGDHQLTAAYRVQLKARTHLIGKSLQELAAAIEKFVHRALVRQPVDLYRGNPPTHVGSVETPVT